MRSAACRYTNAEYGGKSTEFWENERIRTEREYLKRVSDAEIEKFFKKAEETLKLKEKGGSINDYETLKVIATEGIVGLRPEITSEAFNRILEKHWNNLNLEEQLCFANDDDVFEIRRKTIDKIDLKGKEGLLSKIEPWDEKLKISEVKDSLIDLKGKEEEIESLLSKIIKEEDWNKGLKISEVKAGLQIGKKGYQKKDVKDIKFFLGKLKKEAKTAEDIKDIEENLKAIEENREIIIPGEVTFAIIDGTHPIRAWREYKNMRINELAKKIGISGSYLSQIENGKRNPTIKTLKNIASALDIEPEILI